MFCETIGCIHALNGLECFVKPSVAFNALNGSRFVVLTEKIINQNEESVACERCLNEFFNWYRIKKASQAEYMVLYTLQKVCKLFSIPRYLLFPFQ